MNTPQKFFGFLLLPVLTFILGFALAGELRGSENDDFNNRNGDGVPVQEAVISTELFELALQRWEENADLDEEGQISAFRENLEDLEKLLANLSRVNLDIFWEAFEKIEQKYVDPEKITAAEIAEGVVRGLVFSLDDPYSTYLTPEESLNFEAGLAGTLEGIGAELTMKNGLVTVVSPLKESPAAVAGLLPEDIILQVNGEDIETQNLGEVVEKIRGPEGTPVNLTILRRSAPEPLELTITRAHIVIKSVEFQMHDRIAVLEVNQFGDSTEGEFEATLREAVAQNPLGIVLDLRFNPGGYLETAVAMVSAFEKEGKVVVQKGRTPDTINKFVYGAAITDLPLVVLINRGSASAAEIVAGALQDHERALILGETSFGKGTVQEIVPLSDGSYLRLTVAKWLTPNGRDISEKGIEPDVMIERTVEDFESGNDPQLDAALRILRGEVTPEELQPAPVATE